MAMGMQTFNLSIISYWFLNCLHIAVGFQYQTAIKRTWIFSGDKLVYNFLFFHPETDKNTNFYFCWQLSYKIKESWYFSKC